MISIERPTRGSREKQISLTCQQCSRRTNEEHFFCIDNIWLDREQHRAGGIVTASVANIIAAERRWRQRLRKGQLSERANP